ncbi:helix-turn-helix domain-containing protein [Streptomyces sp. YS415]|uniref:AraC-like ligand-binding domain-containing protein n=1 Tax=Streptomyces sp. YS415 TaxID=2944806 RepID=UPI0020202207|nr:helix-turn-helix domain-containing protein [Streptomyces sp. YS415]MCL7429147.1 helix-turn-helix domain-containing protein [Streptomyces sp. YS415]
MLDLETVALADRTEAFHHAMTNDSVPNQIVHEPSDTGVRARMEMWRVGGLPLFSTHNSGFELHRTAAHVRRQRSNPVVSVSLQHRGMGRAETGGRRQVFGPDDIAVFHELVPRVYGWSGDGASQAMVFDVDTLGLPVETVMDASFQLRASPLYELVLRHLRGIWQAPDALALDPGAGALTQATTDLMRALLVSAAAEPHKAVVRSTMDKTMPTRIMTYARQHLTEPDLTPERIAAVHGISVRRLYTVMRQSGVSLEQWIISERLEEARRMLASAPFDHLTIASIAGRCGWTNASHFSRRFQAAFGMTPREWRKLSRDGDV